MEQLILSMIDLDVKAGSLGNVKVCKVSEKSIISYDQNENVVAVIGSRAMSQVVLKLNLPHLKMYQLTSAGFDHVPTAEYKTKGVAVCNAGSVYSQPIAETVVYGMLQYTKRYWKNPKHHFLRPMRKYCYIEEMANKKAIILGCGNIGTSIAKRLQGFDMTIDGYDPFCAEKAEYGKIFKTRQALLKVLNQYRYVITTLPDTKETAGSLNEEFFSAMNKEAIIINVGRKAIFNQHDFLTALRNKTIAGAVLDMFEKIPNPITNPFRRLSNVVILPGVAAVSQEVKIRLADYISQNIRLLLSGKQPNNIIN